MSLGALLCAARRRSVVSAGSLLTWDSATKHASITLSNGDLDCVGTGQDQNVYTQGFDPTADDLYMEFGVPDGIVSSMGLGAKDDTAEDANINLWTGEHAGIHRRGGGGGNIFNWFMNIEGQSENNVADSFGAGSASTIFGILIHQGDVWIHEDGTWMDVTLQSDADNRINPRNSTSISGTTWYFGAAPITKKWRLIPASGDWFHAPSGAVEIRI